jgi:hypothetical protein
MRRTRRRWKRYVTAFLLGAAVLAVAAWSALPALVERSLLQRLEAAGFADADLNVVAVGLAEARMDDVRLDANGEIAAAEITASYDLDGLMGVHLTRVAIKDLRVAGRLDAGGLSIGGLGRANETSGGSFVDGAFLRSVPPVAIESGRIDLATTIGPVVLPLQGTVTPQPDGTLEAAIALDLEADAVDAGGKLDLVLAQSSIGADLRIETGTAEVAGTASSAFSGSARLDWEATGRPRLSADVELAESAVADIAFPTGALAIDATESEWSARLALAGVNGSSDMQADLAIADPYAKPRLAAAVKVTAAAGAWIWPVLGLPQPHAGDARLEVRLAGPLPEGGWPETREANPGEILRLIAAGDVEGTADIVLADLAFPDAVTIDSAAGSADIRAAGGAVTIVPRSALHAAATIAPALLRSLDLPAEAVERLAQPMTADMTLTEPLRLVAGEGQTAARTEFGLQLAGGAGTSLGLQFEGQAVLSDELALVASDGRLRLDGTLPDMSIGGLKAAGVDLDIDAALSLADDRLAIRLVESGAVVARQLAGPPLAGKLKSLTLPLEANDAPLIAIDLRQDASPRATYDLQLGAIKATAPLLLGGPKPLSVAVTLTRTTWTGTWSDEPGAAGAIKVTDGTLAFPSLDVTARGIDADVTLAPDRFSADVRADSIAHSDKPAPIVPLALSGHAEAVGDTLSFTGNLNDKPKRINISIEGEHALATGKGEAKLTMPPLAFEPDGLQPRDVAPAIGAEIEEVTGKAAIGGRISWSKGRLMPKLQLLLQDVSFRSPQLDVLRLNGVAEIDSLVPFTTRPAQQMSAGLVDVGLPLTDVLATFRIEPGPRLMIETARLSLAGGEVTAPPVALDLEQPRTDLALAVSNVDLAKLLELAQIEGLTATGNLGGHIPVTVDANGLVIRDAVLAATGPGTLRYAPTATPSALLGGGESVDLALQALSNFQYTDLKLTVNRATGGDTVALMQVKGRNPDFYGGHAVEFNLNISGKLDQILNRGLAGYRIPDTIRDQLGDFAQ